MLNRIAFALLLACCAVCPAGCQSGEAASSRSDGPRVWRFAIEEPAGSVQHAYALRFKQLVEERSGGDVRVTVYPYGTLGTSDQLTEQLDLGVIQFVMASPGHLGKLIPEVQVFLLHFVLSDDDRVNRAVLSDPDVKRQFDRYYSRKGLKLLSFFSEGWQVWTTQKPIREPDDFQGVKMRVMTSPMLLAAYEAYGASPTPLPYSEVYSALQLNMIEGQENPVFAIQEMSFYEVTEWMIFPNHAPFITSAVTSRAFYDALPPEDQQLVDGVIADLDEYILDVRQQFNSERLDIIKSRKPELNIIPELTPEERAKFREASLIVREQFVDMVGPEGQAVLDLLLETVAEAQREIHPSEEPTASQ